MSKQQAQQPTHLKKQFAEDEEEKKEVVLEAENLQAQPSLAVMNAAPQQQKQGFFASLASKFGLGEKKATRKEAEQDIDRNLSCEEMDSDDLGGDLNLSDREDGMDERNFRREFKANKRAATKVAANVYRQEFDTNVF